jgi:hypothetical protein
MWGFRGYSPDIIKVIRSGVMKRADMRIIVWRDRSGGKRPLLRFHPGGTVKHLSADIPSWRNYETPQC